MLLWQHLIDDVASSFSYFTGDINNELVRHFLIESSSKGVKLKGCPNEPYFGKQKLPPPHVHNLWEVKERFLRLRNGDMAFSISLAHNSTIITALFGGIILITLQVCVMYRLIDLCSLCL